MNKKVLLDLIVPHYKEPWSVGHNMFLMLSMQRNICYKNFRVILVQDGEDGALDWESLFASCPYTVKVITIPHGGTSAARNAGLAASDAEWVMFCDFDDAFVDMYSMSMIMNVMPTDQADVLWMACYEEQSIRASTSFVNCMKENFAASYGKVFRRSFLTGNGIKFPDIPFYMNYVFCSLVLAIAKPSRVMKLISPFSIYTKILRRDSTSMDKNSIAQQIESIFYGDILLVDELEKRNRIEDHRTNIGKAIFDSYHILNSKPQVPHHAKMLELFKEFYQMYKQEFSEIRKVELDIIEQECTNKMINTCVRLYNDFLVEAITTDTGIENVRRWLDSLDTPAVIQPAEIIPNNDEHIIVYTGTRNVYENILASMKSVFANTRVDHVYLLIEDDTFPFDVPDCVSVMNVSGQQYFPESGPNYNNAWSYMCMMRAAFPHIFSQHKKILSLDIDTVITGNIDELWNTDVSGYYLLGVHEKDRAAEDYINFGVVMMNLDLMRKDNIADKVITLLNKDKQQCPEQDAFNTICSGKIRLIDSRFNYTPFTHLIEEPEKEIIIHYAGIQYWKNFSSVRAYAERSWDDILTPHTTQVQAPSAPTQNNTRRVAVYCGTRQIYHMMSASAKSLLSHTRMDKIYFIIEDDAFPEPIPDCIQCINMSAQTFFPPDGANAQSAVTYMDLMRLALPKILPNEHVVLSLDMDVIIHNNIGELWETKLDGKPFAAVQETRNNHNPRTPYYNFGVILMDLDYLRTSGTVDQLIHAVNTKPYAYKAQDCVNDICYKQFVDLPSKYNSFICTDETQTVDIKHYTGNQNGYEKVMFARDSQQYAITPWNDIMKRQKELIP